MLPFSFGGRCFAEDSARWLSALGKQESLRGFQLPKADKLTDKQERICQFLRRIPAVNPAVALLMATQFSTLREILQWFALFS